MRAEKRSRNDDTACAYFWDGIQGVSRDTADVTILQKCLRYSHLHPVSRDTPTCYGQTLAVLYRPYRISHFPRGYG